MVEHTEGEMFDLTCQMCGYEYATAEEAEACEEMHHMAEEEMGVFPMTVTSDDRG